MRGETAHRLTQRHDAQLARPVAEQVQTETGVVEEGQVCAGVAQADDAVRVVQHAAHGLLVAVEQLRGVDGAQVFRQRQVEHHIERVATLRCRDVGQRALLERPIFFAHHLDHVHLVPFAVEQPEAGRPRQFAAQRRAKRGIGQHRAQRLTGQPERWLPSLQAFDRIGRGEREIHRQRAARHLARQTVAARIGGRNRVEVVEHRAAVGAVVQQRRHHHRAPAGGCQRLEEIHRGVTALGQHEDAVAALAHRLHQRRQLNVVGQPRRHRFAALAVVRRAGAAGKADRAGLHRAAHQRLHLRHFAGRRGARGRIGAHHVSAHRRMAHIRRHVDGAAPSPQLSQVLGKGFETPADAAAQHVERHAFDLRQVAHRQIAVARSAWRDREAAVADHCRRHARGRRRPQARVPGDLRVVVGVAVDDARHQHQTAGVDHLRRIAWQVGSDRDDAAGGHRHVEPQRAGAAAVAHLRAADEQFHARHHAVFSCGAACIDSISRRSR